MGGTWDATNVVDARVAVVTPVGAGPRRVPGARRRHDRRGEGRDHQGRLDRRARPPGAGRARHAGAPGGRGGGRRRPRGHRVRRAGAAGRRRRAAGAAAGARRRVRGDLPAAVRRPPGAERGRRAGRGRGVPRRAARRPARSSRRPSAPPSPPCARPAGWSGCAPSPTVLVDAAHNPAGMAATVDAIKESFDFTRLIGVVGCVAGKDVARHARRARGRLRRARRHPEQLAARDARRRARAPSPSTSSAPTGSASRRGWPRRWRRRSSWPRPVRTTPSAAPACWSPAA